MRADKLHLGDRVVMRSGDVGQVRALAWIDDHVFVYYKVGGVERYEPTVQVELAGRP